MKNPEIALAKAAKAQGITRRVFIAKRMENLERVSTRDKWRRADIKAVSQQITEAAERVYGATALPTVPPRPTPTRHKPPRSVAPDKPVPPKPLTRAERHALQQQRDRNAKTMRSMRASKGWTHYHVWEPKIATIKQGDGTAHMMTREKLYTVFVSPKGNEYTHALDTEPADLLHVGVTKKLGVPPVRLIRVNKSQVVKRSEQARRRAEKIRQAREEN